MNKPLSQWMKKHNQCDRQVAADIRVSRVTISRIRRGICGASVRTAMRLQEWTGIKWWNFIKNAPPVAARRSRKKAV